MILLHHMVLIHYDYEMFMGPLDAAIAWSEKGLDGSRRFLDRVWRLIITDENSINKNCRF